MADFFEFMMVLCFGLSWPLNIRKAWVSRSTKSTSLPFYLLIWVGYICILISKIIKLHMGIHTPGYVWFFYCLNTLMVTSGILIYFRNKKLESNNA